MDNENHKNVIKFNLYLFNIWHSILLSNIAQSSYINYLINSVIDELLLIEFQVCLKIISLSSCKLFDIFLLRLSYSTVERLLRSGH